MIKRATVRQWGGLCGTMFALACILGGVRADQYRSEEMAAPAAVQPGPRQTPEHMLAAAKTPYARAMLLRDLAARAVADKDYLKAAGYLQQALAQNALAAPVQALMQQQLGVLLAASGDPAQVIKALEPVYRKGGALAPAQQAALGSAYVRDKRYAEALTLLEKAVAAQSARSAPLPVPWLEALAAAQLGAGRDAEAEPTLSRLVQVAPADARHWQQLAALQVRLGHDVQALATLELAARLGYLTTAAQRLALVGVAARAGLPYRAAAILQADLQAKRVAATPANWQRLALLWTRARERALAIAAWRAAIDAGGGAALHAQIGALALQMQDYATAAAAFEAAGTTPALRLDLGIARFYAGHAEAARKAFAQAAKGGGTAGEQARQWLAFVQTAGARAELAVAARQSPPRLAALQPRDPLAGRVVKLDASIQPAVVAAATTATVSAPALAALDALDLRRFTPVGAERMGSADGTVPAWVGGLTPAHWPAGWKPGQRLIDPFATDKALFTVTAENMARYAKYLSPGQQALFRKFPDYQMIVYPARRTVAYPQAIYAATRENLGRAKLLGPDALSGARLGFPFPRPDSGVQVMWNHRVRYRGGSSRQQSSQAVVFADGRRVLLRQTELVYSRYANIQDPVDIDRDNILLDYLTWFDRPTGGFDFAALVHETANSLKSPRAMWVLPPRLGRMFRVPPLGYDQPLPGSSGLYFLDMVDMYNGPFDRYVWKLTGKRELLIPYNAYRLASGRDSYDALLTPHHFNQSAVRYEMHRVWQIDATLRGGAHHAFGKRVFYVDEDSWNVVLVDNYDPSGQLWRIQEGHLLPLYGVQAAVCAPVVTYDLKQDAYFVNHLIGQEPPGRYGLKGLNERQFQPAVVQARFGR